MRLTEGDDKHMATCRSIQEIWCMLGQWLVFMCQCFKSFHPPAFSSKTSKASLINAMSRLLTSRDTSSLMSVAPDPSTSGEQIIPIDFDPSDRERLFDILRKGKPKFLPLEVLPCANMDAMKYKVCPKQGNKACSACKLVSYCSKVRLPLPPMWYS
jgi:hypothetical protein